MKNPSEVRNWQPSPEQQAFARHLEETHSKSFPGIGDRYLAQCGKAPVVTRVSKTRREALLKTLQSEKGKELSDDSIAQQYGVSDRFVSKLRHSLNGGLKG